MQLKIYKLSELAKLEWIHYKTALQRAKTGKYIAVSYYNSTVGKETARYLSKSDSDIILAAFNSLEAKKDEIQWSNQSLPELPEEKRKLWSGNLWLPKKYKKNPDSTAEAG